MTERITAEQIATLRRLSEGKPSLTAKDLENRTALIQVPFKRGITSVVAHVYDCAGCEGYDMAQYLVAAANAIIPALDEIERLRATLHDTALRD